MEPGKIDFIGVGVAKSGTTWLADTLRGHPGIFIPDKKELIYFNREMPNEPGVLNYRFNKSQDWYHDFFKDALPGQIKGEVTPHYFFSDEGIERIYAYNPSIKIIVVIRNPVERSLSSYRYAIQIGAIKKMDFETALQRHPDILDHSFYSDQLEKWFLRFGKENVGVFLFDDIVHRPEQILKDICRFLGAPPFAIRNIERKANPSKANRISHLNYFITQSRIFIHRNQLLWIRPLLRYTGLTYLAERITTLNQYGKPETDVLPEIKDMLLARLLQDIEKTEILLGKDLSHWKIIKGSPQYQ